MRAPISKYAVWAGAIGLAYSALVVLAYAVGPPTTAACSIAGHGQITAADGNPSSFRGLIASTPPAGAEFYRDNGPSNGFRMHSLSVDAVTCGADASNASVSGKASLTGRGSLEYRIDIQLAASEHGNDTYRIRLASGYDSGTQSIRHGEVDIHQGQSEHRHLDPDANQNRGGQQDGT